MFKEKFELLKKELEEHELIKNQIYKKRKFYNRLSNIFAGIWFVLFIFTFSLLPATAKSQYIAIILVSLLIFTCLISYSIRKKYEEKLSELNNNYYYKDWLKDFNFNEEEILENLEVILEMESNINVLNKYFSNNINFFISNIKEIHQKILKNNDINVFLRIMDFDYEEKKLILLSKDIEWLAEVVGKEKLYNEMSQTIDYIMYEKEIKYYEIIKDLFYDFLEDKEYKEEINNFIDLKNQIIKEIKEIKNEKLEIKKEITIINI